MRHGKRIIKLGRKTAHRKAMLANMANSLIEHKRITTTSTKAKALKVKKLANEEEVNKAPTKKKVVKKKTATKVKE